MKYYIEPVIDILLFDEDEILAASTQWNSQNQAANFILGHKVNGGNVTGNGSDSSMAGVDARSIPINRVNTN